MFLPVTALRLQQNFLLRSLILKQIHWTNSLILKGLYWGQSNLLLHSTKTQSAKNLLDKPKVILPKPALRLRQNFLLRSHRPAKRWLTFRKIDWPFQKVALRKMKTFSLDEHPLQPEIKLSWNRFNFGIPNVLLIDFYIEIKKIAPGYKNLVSKRRLSI